MNLCLNTPLRHWFCEVIQCSGGQNPLNKKIKKKINPIFKYPFITRVISNTHMYSPFSLVYSPKSKDHYTSRKLCKKRTVDVFPLRFFWPTWGLPAPGGASWAGTGFGPGLQGSPGPGRQLNRRSSPARDGGPHRPVLYWSQGRVSSTRLYRWLATTQAVGIRLLKDEQNILFMVQKRRQKVCNCCLYESSNDENNGSLEANDFVLPEKRRSGPRVTKTQRKLQRAETRAKQKVAVDRRYAVPMKMVDPALSNDVVMKAKICSRFAPATGTLVKRGECTNSTR